MAQAINGVQQAGTDRATRIAQILEQRHLQTEMAAAAFAREDQRQSAEVAKAGESEHAKAGDRDGHGGHGHPGESRKKRPDEPPPASPDGSSGRIVDLTA
jgi:hypothetical protein